MESSIFYFVGVASISTLALYSIFAFFMDE